MKHFVALIAGVALSAGSLGIASADQTFGAGRNGANGMSDRWSKPSETLERYGTDLETKTDDAAPPLGAGRFGANGMSDPAYQRRSSDIGEPFGVGRGSIDPARPEGPRPFSAGDAPIDHHDRTFDGQSVPNGH